MVPTVALTDYNGLDFGQSSLIQANTIGGGATPPDPQGAAGPSSYIEAVNLSLAIFTPNSSGVNPMTDAMDDFFNFQGNLPDPNPGDLYSNGFSDPSVVFVPQIQRFVVSCMEVDPGPQFGNQFTGNNSSVFDFAVSKTSNPLSLTLGDWNFYQINTTEPNEFSDFPGNLGYNDGALVVTLNEINVNTQQTDHVLVTAINMNDLANGVSQANLHVYQSDFQGASLRPTTMQDSKSVNDPMWFVQEHPGTGGLGDGQHIDVVKMSNVLSSTPTYTTTTLAVNPYTDISKTPPLQPGGTVVTPALDSRILKSAEQNNLLVATQAVSVSPTQDDAQWYEIDLSSGTPKLKQQGDVSAGNNTYITYPSIDINAKGDIGMSYMRSGTDSPTDFLSMYVTGRKPSDASGTMETPILAQAGQQVYEDFGPQSGSVQRAGDLSGINVDPQGNFWTVNEFADNEPLPTTNNPRANWGTHITRFTLDPVMDLAVTATGPTKVTPGGSASYTITLTNNGPNAAQNVVLTDTLPAGATGATITPVSNPDGFSFTLQGGIFTSGPVTVASGHQDKFTITVSVPSSLGPAAAFDDIASASSSTTDSNPYNNAATVSGKTGRVIAVNAFFNAINYQQSATILGGAGSTPPDNQGAVGPSSYVEAVNDAIAIYRPQTGTPNPITDSLDDFFATQGQLPDPNPNDAYGNFITDPFVVFDEQTQRFIVGAIEVDPGPQFVAQSTGNNSSVLDLAVSTSADPKSLTTNDWNFYQVNTTEANMFSDYPGNVGYNGGALVVTLNEFNTANMNQQNPDHVLVTAINMSDLTSGVSQANLHFYQSDFQGMSLRPTTMHDSTSANDPMWFVQEHLAANGNPDNQHIDVVKMSNVLSSTPTFTTTTLAVTPYSQIVPPLQPDGSVVTAYLDSRIMKVAEQGGTLVAAQAVANAAGNQDLVQWYQIDVSSGTPVMKQQGDVGSGPNTYLYFPGIDINPAGDIGMSYIQSGTDNPNDFMSMYITGRMPSDPSGTMEAPVIAQYGQQVYEDFAPAFGVSQRAGDLSGINVDSQGNFWAINQFADGEPVPTSPTNPVADPNLPAADWATHVVSFSFPATRVWTGKSTISSNWTDPANWAGGVAPNPGDSLVFGPGASQLVNTDNFAAGTAFGSITFSSAGYTISGNAITLDGNLDGHLATGNNTFNPNVTLGNGAGVLTGPTNTDLTLGGTITDGSNLTVGGGVGRVDFTGAITGAGGVTINDAGGTVALSGPADTYTGKTTVQAGTLLLDKSSGNAVPGTLIVSGGTVRLLAGNQIADTAAVTISTSGLLDLNNNSDAVGSVTLSTGTVTTGTGTLTLGGNVIDTGVSSIAGNLALGAAGRTFTVNTASTLTVSAAVSGSVGLTKTGSGTLVLSTADGYSGGTALSAGTLTVGNNSALGSGGLTLANGTTLSATGSAVTLTNPLTINGNVTFAGTVGLTLSAPIVLTANRTFTVSNTAGVTLAGGVSESGGSRSLTKNGAGMLILPVADSYSGGTTLNAGTLVVGNNSALGTGMLTIKGGALNATGGAVTLANALTLSGNFRIGGNQALTFTGAVTLTGTRTINVSNTSSTTLAGNIGQSVSGLGLTKTGTGTLILSGTNSYTGTTTISVGTLLVNGSQAGSAVSVSSGATLGGTGTVGSITAVSGGHVAPGAGAGLPGILTAAAVTLPSGSTFNVALNGTTAGSGYAQLSASGPINITNSTLTVSLGFTPAIGNSFTIIHNTGSSAIVGTFNGLAQNATFTQNGMVFQISYTGGSGQDVVLTRIS